MKLWKILAVTLLVLSVMLCMAACGGDPVDTTPNDTDPANTDPVETDPVDTDPPKLPGELPHDCVWSEKAQFVAYETADENGAIGCLAPVCTVEGCSNANFEGEIVPVLLNMDFETAETKMMDYVKGLHGVAPYYRTDSVTTGMIQSGLWYNTTFEQVLFDETLGLRDRNNFTISFDFMLGLEASSKDRILAWGASGDDYAFSPRFMLSVDAEGKLHYYTKFNENAKGTAALSSYTFDDRMCWYHLDLDVDVLKQTVTVSVGKWADMSFTEYLDYTTVGTCAVGFGQVADTSTHDCFRISDKQGLLAMDNFVISTPTKSAGGNQGGSDVEEDLPGLQPHDCVWSTDTKFYTHESIQAEGILGYMVPYCTVKGCKEVKLAEKQGTVLLNMDFETDATKLLDYVKELDGVAPFGRSEALTSGIIQNGVWYNTTFDQVFIGEELGLRDVDVFTVSYDCMLGMQFTSGVKDMIFGWCGYGEGSDGLTSDRFTLNLGEDNKLHYLLNYKDSAERTAALAGYTFDDRLAWYHFEYTINNVDQTLTISIGKWTDASLTELTDYQVLGTVTDFYMNAAAGARVKDAFRLNRNQGNSALDNFIVYVPVAE